MLLNLFHIQVKRQAELTIIFYQVNSTCSILGQVMILSCRKCSNVLPESWQHGGTLHCLLSSSFFAFPFLLFTLLFKETLALDPVCAFGQSVCVVELVNRKNRRRIIAKSITLTNR